LKYLDTLIKEWGNKYNLAIFISMHAAKGSQNGFDHSAPPSPGKSYWGQYRENIDTTIDAV
jgi:glucan 1,3-beta-glucosidase